MGNFEEKTLQAEARAEFAEKSVMKLQAEVRPRLSVEEVIFFSFWDGVDFLVSIMTPDSSPSLFVFCCKF